MAYLDDVKWNSEGLVPAIAQDWKSGIVLMMAWMNAEALRCTLNEGRAVYWSRSRERLWRKGESSGHTQLLKELRLDCDADTLLLRVEQLGGMACHTGRAHCFFRSFKDDSWQVVDSVLRDPVEIYGTAD
ncbi:MAG: phosphoribosyl-AMP cyclohydrolase [Congregibacter sp.]